MYLLEQSKTQRRPGTVFIHGEDDAADVRRVILLGLWPLILLDRWPHVAAVSLDRMALLGSEEG